ncbi:MAG: GPI anchored serine-threonine rich family protein [Spirochaetales bacterium]
MKSKFTRIALLAVVTALVAAGCEFQYKDGWYDDYEDDRGRTTDPVLFEIVAPTGRSVYAAGDVLQIAWDGEAEPALVKIELYLSGEPVLTITEGVQNRGGYDWPIPNDFSVNSEVINEYQIVASGFHPDYENDLELAAYSAQFTIEPAATGGLSDVEVSRRTIDITLIDDGSEIDSDTIDLYLNGALIAGDHVLEESPGTVFSLLLDSGENVLEIYAVNEGNVPPNTALLKISHVTVGESSQQWRLSSGETGRLTISAP